MNTDPADGFSGEKDRRAAANSTAEKNPASPEETKNEAEAATGARNNLDAEIILSANEAIQDFWFDRFPGVPLGGDEEDDEEYDEDHGGG